MFNNYLLDGMDNNAYGESNQGFDNQIIAIAPDSVAQFDVVTNNESAEYGRFGATVNVASRSGGNQVHATLYEFLRNTDLNAAGFFKPNIVSNTGKVTPFREPAFNRNQFGRNFGGPILRDKLFYFLDYEGFRQTLTPLSVLTLPTQNELNGVLVVPVRNPVTGTTYAAGTAIPSTAFDPLNAAVVSYFKKIPLPTSGLASTGLNSNDYSVEAPFTDYSDKGDLRLDYQQNASSSWFLRISDRKETGVNHVTIPLPLDGQTNGTIRILDQQAALGNTYLFGPNKILDARLGISRTKAGKYNLSTLPSWRHALRFPAFEPHRRGRIAFGGNHWRFTGFGRQSTNPQWQNPALLDPKVNFTWVKGAHSLKFGYEYEHIWMAVNDNNPLYGSWTYGGGYSLATRRSQPTARRPQADRQRRRLRFPTPTGRTSFRRDEQLSLANYFVVHLRQTLDSAYAQDDWKVTPKLTLNLGLRWEYGSPYSEWKNYISNWDPAAQTVDTITPGAVAGNGITPVTADGVYGKTLMNPDLTDFMPRIGLAYAPWTRRPTRRVRDRIRALHAGRLGRHSGDQRAAGAVCRGDANQANDHEPVQLAAAGPDHCNRHDDAELLCNGQPGIPIGTGDRFNPATDNITWVPKNTPDSYVENYFLSVQQQLAKNSLLDIAYVAITDCICRDSEREPRRIDGANWHYTATRGRSPPGLATLPRHQRILLELQRAGGAVRAARGGGVDAAELVHVGALAG